MAEVGDDYSVSPTLPLPWSGSLTKEGSNLTNLPSEVLVHILAYLDTRSLLYLRRVCSRLFAIINDPVNWTRISWEGNNNINDLEGLKLALNMSISALREISVSSPWRYGYQSTFFAFSKLINQIQACNSLQSVSLIGIKYTLNQISKLLKFPSLKHLEVQPLRGIISVIAESRCNLRSLSLLLLLEEKPSTYIEEWSIAGCIPADLRISGSHREVYFPGSNITNVLTSTDHRTCLTFSKFTTITLCSFTPSLQINFLPRSTLQFVKSDLFQLRLVLSEKEFGSNNFSGATYLESDPRRIKELVIKDVSQNLAYINLFYLGYSQNLECIFESISTSCPNLLYFELPNYGTHPMKLDGLQLIASNCIRLQVFSMFGSENAKVDCVDRLWTILTSMSNLKVLIIPWIFMIRDAVPVPMPNLIALYISRVHRDIKDRKFSDSYFKFLTNMPSLKVFKFNRIPPVNVFSGVSMLLNASNKITHLYLAKETGNKLNLPTDPVCYTYLEEMYLECNDFIFSDELTNALEKSHNLRVIVLKISLMSCKNIELLVHSLKSLSTFFVTMSEQGTLKSQAKCISVSKSLCQAAKKRGKILDIRIMMTVSPCAASMLCTWFPGDYSH